MTRNLVSRRTALKRISAGAAPALPQNEGNAAVTLEAFFLTAKQATVHGYYTSEIGIHQELRYKGNKVLLQFVGCQTVDGKDCPHCGQKAEA